MHTIIDWNGDGFVDGDELRDLIYVSEFFEYIDQTEAGLLNAWVGDIIEHFDGPFTYEQLKDFQDSAEGSSDPDIVRLNDQLTEIIEMQEDMLIDLAVAIVYDDFDINGDGEFRYSQLVGFIDKYNFSAEEE